MLDFLLILSSFVDEGQQKGQDQGEDHEAEPNKKRDTYIQVLSRFLTVFIVLAQFGGDYSVERASHFREADTDSQDHLHNWINTDSSEALNQRLMRVFCAA